MGDLREEVYAAASKAIERASMFDPGEKTERMQELLNRDGKVAADAVVAEIVTVLKNHYANHTVCSDFNEAIKLIEEAFA